MVHVLITGPEWENCQNVSVDGLAKILTISLCKSAIHRSMNEKEQRNVSGGFVDTRSPLDILNEEKLDPFKKPNREEDFTKFW